MSGWKDRKKEDQELKNKISDLGLLIVDDEEAILESLGELFKNQLKVYTANSGEEAMELFNKHRPQLILSDQRMPDITGIELISEIKKLEPNTIRILITGYSDIEAVITAVNEQLLYKYVTKPWNNKELTEIIMEGARKYLIDCGLLREDLPIYF